MIDFLEISAEKFKELYPDEKLPVGVKIVRIPHLVKNCNGCKHNHRRLMKNEIEICLICLTKRYEPSK
jgi:hypothetical protein